MSRLRFDAEEFAARRAQMDAGARVLADELTARLPVGLGFALLLFEFGAGGERGLAWISNAERRDMIKAAIEWLGHAAPPQFSREAFLLLVAKEISAQYRRGGEPGGGEGGS